jgi:Mg-chelatase subunit ChlD
MAATGHFKATVECYDCHEQVRDLKAHRATCTRSHRAKSVVGSRADRAPKLKKTGPRPTDHTDHYALLDVSGSMAGSRLRQAKETFADIVAGLPDADRLAIITFDDQAFFKLRPRPVEQIKRQQELPALLERIFAQGRTALYDAILLAVSQIRDKEMRTIINVLTDGEDNASKHTLAEVRALVAEYPRIRLNIIHIGAAAIADYQQLCTAFSGHYEVVVDVEIKIKFTALFVPTATLPTDTVLALS